MSLEKFSQLPLAVSISGPEYFPIVQGNVNKRITIAQLVPILSGSSALIVGSSLVTMGTTGDILFNNGGVLGNFAVGGDGTLNTGTGALTISSIGGKAVTLGGTFTISGAFTTTLTITGNTSVTLPTSGTLVNSGVTTLSSLTSIGTIGTGTWQGTVVTGQYGGTGVANTGSTITLGGNLATSGAHALTLTIGADTNVTLPSSGTLAILGANTFTGTQTLAAGTTSLSPLTFQSGTNLTAATAGAKEYDGKVFYATSVASSRQVISTQQFTTVQGTAVSLSNSSTGVQDIFGTGGQVLSLAAATTYYFEGFFDFSTGGTTHTTALGLVASSAFTNIYYWAELWSTTSGSISTTAPSVLDVTASTATVLNSTSAATHTAIRVRGIVRTNAASTITPQVTFSSGPTGTCQTNINSYFRILPLGVNTVQAVGNWA